MADRLPWAEERPDLEGRFDELICTDVSMVHVEMMDSGHVWIAIDGAGGRVTLSLTSKKKIKVSAAHERDLAHG